MSIQIPIGNQQLIMFHFKYRLSRAALQIPQPLNKKFNYGVNVDLNVPSPVYFTVV